MVDDLKEKSELSSDQTNMLGNLLKLGNIQVGDIMVPRADIIALPKTTDFEDTLKLFKKAAHSRLPVYKNQLDNIIGMVHVKDLLPFWNKQSLKHSRSHKCRREVMVLVSASKRKPWTPQLRRARGENGDST